MAGASSNHVVTALRCILSFVYAFPFSPVLFVDFGITDQERCWLSYIFKVVKGFHDSKNVSAPIYFRTVNWSNLPDWMHITKAMNNGGYAWKPIVIADAFYQWKGIVMWNDAGNLYRSWCNGAVDAVRKEGIYIPYDPAKLNRNFHDDSYSFLVHYHLSKPINRNTTSGRGGFMLFDYSNAVCRNEIMVRWVQCAFTRRCMTLKGVGRKQHLPEQGVLSVLIMNHNISLSCSTRTNYFPHFWSDKNKNNTVIPNAPLEYDMTTFSEASGQPYTQKQLVSDCLRFS